MLKVRVVRFGSLFFLDLINDTVSRALLQASAVVSAREREILDMFHLGGVSPHAAVVLVCHACGRDAEPPARMSRRVLASPHAGAGQWQRRGRGVRTTALRERSVRRAGSRVVAALRSGFGGAAQAGTGR